MKQCVKRYLAVILTLAMVFTMIPSTLVRAEGEEGGTVETTQVIPASKFVVSGGQSDPNNHLIATNTNGTDGTNVAAAYIAGETASSAEGGLGSSRVGGMAFELPGNLNAESISKATVTVNATSVNQNLGDRWIKAGLLAVDASHYETMVSEKDKNEAPTYPALNDDYSAAATSYSNERISADNLGPKTFDVTEWVKRSVTSGDKYAIYRFQTVMCGFSVANAGENAPTLSITTTGPQGSVLESAVASYDFDKFQKAEGADALTDGERTLALESVGSGVKPALTQDDRRGQVLSLTRQDYNNRAYALLPSNPFAGKSVDNGLTLSFWTKSKNTPENGRCLIDFEVAPATTGRAGTVAVNQYYVYWNTTDQNQKYMDFHTNNLDLAPANGWVMVTMAVTKEGVTFYRNNKKISHDITAQFSTDYVQLINDLAGTSDLVENPQDTKVRIGASLATYWSCAGAWIDDISFYDRALSAGEVAALFNETSVAVPLESVTVTGPKEVDEEKTIQLSRTLAPADTTVDTTTTWASSNENILTVDANGKVKGVNPGTATITATVAGISSEPYEITVNDLDFTEELAAGKYLTVYSTEKHFHASNKKRVAQETRSVYMAVSSDGKNFDVLNNGGGVIFSKNGSGTKEVTEPRIYKEGDTFKVVARDGNASKGYHIYTSKDGVNYYDDVIESSYTHTETTLKKSKFTLMLNGENILETDDTITLGNALKLTDAEYTYIVNKLGQVVNNGLEPLADVDATSAKNTEEVLGMLQESVNATFTDGSVQNFKIDWSDAIKKVDLSKAGTYELTGNVVQTKYLNNLKELNGSKLPEDDPEKANPDYPNNYNPETGEVYYDATKFVEGMADPFIFWDEQSGYYYMTGSYFPEAGDAMPGETPDQYDRVVLRRGRTLEDLQDRSKQVTIWKVGNQGYIDNGNQVNRGYRYIWAPEIHRVGNYWVVYFTQSHNSGNAFNIYSHALVLDGSKDPYETALKASNEASQWQDYKMCKEGNFTDPFATAFCLDMTYFKDEKNGKSYVVWAGKPSTGNTDLHIATVSEAEPWKITSAATSITSPEYGWEVVDEIVNEGATILQKDGKIFLCYSGAGTGSEYAIGMLSAENGADLLNKSSWTKSPYPVLSSRDVNGEEGPGHNSFTVDKDGNVIFVYHARPTSHNYQKCGWNGTSSTYNGSPLNDPCRHARLKRVHWAADGTPILKMTYDEELLEANQTVKVKVKVAGVTDTVAVTGISLDKTTLSLTTGAEATLAATVTPNNATDKTVTWSSDKTSVATVVNGKVTAVAAGEATITAKAGDKTATCKVTVTDPVPPVVEVTGVALDKKTLTIYVKDKAVALKATVAPANATNQAVTWSSSNEKIAKVDAKGNVTPVAKGTATITVKTANGKTATCKVTVKVRVSKVKLSKTKATIGEKESLTLKATVSPSSADKADKKVTWKSSNTKLATVSSKGVVKAKKAGKVTITAKAGGKSATCKITIKKAPTKITVKKSTMTVKRKKTAKIKYTLKPSGARDKVTYKSNKPKIAKVSSSGVITGVKKGTAKITVKTYNGKKATITVKVK